MNNNMFWFNTWVYWPQNNWQMQQCIQIRSAWFANRLKMDQCCNFKLLHRPWIRGDACTLYLWWLKVTIWAVNSGCKGSLSQPAVTQLEESRQSKIQEDAKKRKEDKARRAAVNEATSLPRQVADKRIEDKMDEKLQPLLEKVRSLEEQLRKNGAAPTAADQDGADARSATKKRKKSKRPRATEGAEASSEAKRRKRRPAMEESAACLSGCFVWQTGNEGVCSMFVWLLRARRAQELISSSKSRWMWRACTAVCHCKQDCCCRWAVSNLTILLQQGGIWAWYGQRDLCHFEQAIKQLLSTWS